MLLTPSLHGAVYMAMSIITTQVDGKQGLEKGIFFVSEWTNADKKWTAVSVGLELNSWEIFKTILDFV